MVFDNVDQFFDDLKVSVTSFCLFDCSCHGISFNNVAFQQKVLLKYGFARDERVELADGRFADIDMLEQMLCRVQMYDQTEHPLGNDADVSGPRAQTYQNESLARGGARSIRSDHHITGGYAVSLAGEPLPPLYIFSSDAKDKKALRRGEPTIPSLSWQTHNFEILSWQTHNFEIFHWSGYFILETGKNIWEEGLGMG